MNWFQTFGVFCWAIVGLFSLFALGGGSLSFFDVMIDRHGRWRIPTDGTVTQIANAIIKAFPRFDSSFSVLEDSQFDMDNSSYVQSTIMYVVLFGVIGAVIAVIILIIMVGRYCCNCCGGKGVRRKGYPENQINFFRYSIIIISFILEAILIYGYFANTDLHSSLSVLADSFENISNQILSQMNQIYIPSESFPGIPETVTMDMFQEDFKFSVRYAAGQADAMNNFIDKFELARMIFIILNLVISTVGCALGIAAGSVRKGTPVLVMVILFTVADLLFFISFGIHFAGSKLVYDFCNEIGNYIDMNSEDMIPMRLQYFVPCVNSPVFPFIKNHMYFQALKNLGDFKTAYQTAQTEIDAATDPVLTATWENFSLIEEYVTSLNNEAISKQYANTKNATNQMVLIEQSTTCRWSKNEMRLDEWLLCTYAKDNLDMIMITQGAGCIVLLILTILGIPAIKRFKFAGNANLAGVLDGKKAFFGKHAKAKR